MHLLRSSPVSAPEFVSLSLLMEPNTMEAFASSSGEPLMLVSPGSTLSSSDSIDAVEELSKHLSSTLTPMSMIKKQDAVTIELLQEDEKLLDEIQIFRPLCASGVALHYRLIRGDVESVSKIATLVLASNKNSETMMPLPEGVSAVLFCVGMSGLPFAHGTSKVQYFLSQRISDCTKLLARISLGDISAVKTVLSTFLLSEDDHRTTNIMAEAANLLAIPDSAEAKGVLSPFSPLSRKRSPMIGGTGGSAGSANEAMVSLTLNANSAELARKMTDCLTIMSVVDDESLLRKYSTSGKERKTNLDLTGGGKSRFRRRKGDPRDVDFEGFDYKGPKKDAVTRKRFQPLASAPKPPGGASALRMPKKDTRSKGGSSIPALMGPPRGQRRMGSQASVNSQNEGVGGFQSPPLGGSRKKMPNRRSNFHNSPDDVSETLSQAYGDAGSTASPANRIHINVALNEDLSCSYKDSQLTSCSVEGVVQVQVESNARSALPFFLSLYDPAGHVESLDENKKFADDHSDGEHLEERTFTVSVPEAGNYFPVLRYKCVDELRPVPVRVQARVRADGGFCRVALQVSSNPNNEAKLTDLTIIMGVPNDVRGDTLVTQPAGGVWNDSKRSVIWCVSELGDGEKFQLQARFDMDNAYVEKDKPKFPVLVRCQCLFAQLSDIAIEVSDIPDIFPADVSMKLARRFRLSHRERS